MKNQVLTFTGLFLFTTTSFGMGINRCDGSLILNDFIKFQWAFNKSLASYSNDIPRNNGCTDNTGKSLKLIPQRHTAGFVGGLTSIKSYIGNYRTSGITFKIPAKAMPNFTHLFPVAALDDATFNRSGATVWGNSTIRLQFTHSGCSFGNNDLFKTVAIPGGLKADKWYRLESQVLYIDATTAHVTGTIYDFPMGAATPRALISTAMQFNSTGESTCRFNYMLNSKFTAAFMSDFAPEPANTEDVSVLMDDFTATADVW